MSKKFEIINKEEGYVIGIIENHLICAADFFDDGKEGLKLFLNLSLYHSVFSHNKGSKNVTFLHNKGTENTIEFTSLKMVSDVISVVIDFISEREGVREVAIAQIKEQLEKK